MDGLGAIIKRRIHLLGMTDSAFARSLGVPQSTFAKWVNDKHEPSLIDFRKLCDALRADPKELLYLNDENFVRDTNEKIVAIEARARNLDDDLLDILLDMSISVEKAQGARKRRKKRKQSTDDRR